MIAANQGYGVPATCQVLCWMLHLHYVIWCFCLLHVVGTASLFQAACPVAMQLVRRTKTESKPLSNPVLLTRGRYHHPLLLGGTPGKLGLPASWAGSRILVRSGKRGRERSISWDRGFPQPFCLFIFFLSPVPEWLTYPLSTAAYFLPPRNRVFSLSSWNKLARHAPPLLSLKPAWNPP